MIRAMQAEFGAERVNEVVGRAIKEIARKQGEEARAAGRIDSMAALADRFQDGVLREGSLIVDIVERVKAVRRDRARMRAEALGFLALYAPLALGLLFWFLGGQEVVPKEVKWRR